MIDYHRPVNAKTLEIGQNVYLHDSGMVGKVMDIKPNRILLDIDAKAYSHAKDFKNVSWWDFSDAIHTCEAGEETPKPVIVHRYLLEDDEYPWNLR